MTSPLPDKTFEREDGNNVSLSFTGTGTGFNSVRARITKLEFDWSVVATESHARIHRAMYPHQRALGMFSLTFALKGYREYKGLMDYFRSYIQQFVGAQKRSMYVSCPVRNFNRWGVPVTGIADGDHVGQTLFTPTIVFQSINDPLEQYFIYGYSPSNYSFGGATGDQAKFFFPFSIASAVPNVTPDAIYNAPPGQSITDGISGALSNAIGNVIGAIGNTADAAGRANDTQNRQSGTGR